MQIIYFSGTKNETERKTLILRALMLVTVSSLVKYSILICIFTVFVHSENV